MASSSTATRKSQWSSFQRFCDGHSLVSLPCTEHTVCLFIAELSQRHLEYNTVVNYIHSITSLHHRHDHLGPDLQHFSIREALAGLQRSRRELPYQKQAITLHHLHCIHRELRGLPRERRAVFWAACLTAFNSLLRSANLFPQPAQPDKAIRRMDVTRTALGLELTIRVLKTNRFSGEELKIPLHRLPIQNYLCPVRAIERLLAQDFPPLSPLFSHTESGKTLHLSARQFVSDLRSCLASNKESASFSTHSFRRGGTTFAIDNGVDISAVKAQGNWRSDCYNRYVDNKPALKNTFTATVARSVAVRRK